MFAPRGTRGGRVAVEPIDAKRWILTEPLRYVGEVNEFIVPEGYVTDFASVPRIVVWLVPSYGLYTKAAILHDYLITDELEAGRICSRDVDGLFRRALRELGVPPVKRWLMWTAVRWGALFNAKRRDGWIRSAPGVLAISIPALVFLPAVVLVALSLAIYGGAEAVATIGRPQGPSTGTIST